MIHTSLLLDSIVTAALILVGGAVWALTRRRDKYAPAWKPLLVVVGGTSRAGRLTGTYSGLPVSARVAQSGDGLNFWELSLALPACGVDWTLTYTGQKFLGSGTRAWRVKSKEEDAASRLVDAGAVTAMQQWQGYPEIDYKAKTGLLTYRDRVDGPLALPSVDRFREQLDLLSRLAEIIRQAGI